MKHSVMNMNHPARNALITLPQSNWLRTALSALALGVVLGVTGCKESTPSDGATPAQQYTCPMHPEVVKDGPGDCPKCGMQLVEKQ